MALMMNISAKLRWWVMPLMMVCKFLARLRVMKEKHVQPVVTFIGKHGIKISMQKAF